MSIIARVGDPAVDSLRVAPGDTVFLLYETAEGWNWWHRGITYEGGVFWEELSAAAAVGAQPGPQRRPEAPAAVLLSPHRREDWWHVALGSGESGWWHAGSAPGLRSTGDSASAGALCPPPSVRR